MRNDFTRDNGGKRVDVHKGWEIMSGFTFPRENFIATIVFQISAKFPQFMFNQNVFLLMGYFSQDRQP